MERITCFIGGPYSSKYGWFGRVSNILRMARYKYHILKMGYVPVAPNVIYCLLSHLQPREYWLEGTQKLLRQCDVLFLIPGWESSSGARAEHDLAASNNQPIFTSLTELKRYLQRPQ